MVGGLVKLRLSSSIIFPYGGTSDVPVPAVFGWQKSEIQAERLASVRYRVSSEALPQQEPALRGGRLRAVGNLFHSRFTRPTPVVLHMWQLVTLRRSMPLSKETQQQLSWSISGHKWPTRDQRTVRASTLSGRTPQARDTSTPRG